MRNIIQQQDDLKNLSQQQLIAAMQSGTYPQFLVLSELNRRKRMTDDQARREAADDTTTVAQEVVNAAGVPQGGIAQLAGAMNAKTDNTQNTGIEELIPKQPVRMKEGGTPQYKNRYEMLMAYLFGRDGDEEKEKPREGKSLAEMINFGGDYEPVKKAEGGVVKMKTAGSVRTDREYIAELKRLYPEVYELYKDNYNEKDLADLARAYLEGSVSTPDKTGIEQLETPRTNLQKIMDFAKYSPLKARKNMEKIESTAAERELQAQQETQRRLREKPDLVEGTPADPLTGIFKFPRTLDQVGSPMIKAPNMASDISSSLSNISQPNPEVTLGSILPPEISMSQPFVPQGLSVPQGNVGVGGKAKEDIIKSLLAGENPFETGVPLELQADAATDLNKRAREFYNTDTYTPPEMIYSGDVRDILKREEATPEEIQAASDRLAKQAAADEAAKTQASLTDLTENNKEGLGPDAAAAVREGALRRLQDQMQPTLVEGVNIPEREKNLGSYLVDAGEAAVKGVGSLYDYGTEKLGPLVPSITEAVTQVGGDINSLYKRLTDDTIYPVDGAIDNQPQDREPLPDVSKQANEAAEAKVDPTQAALNKIIENQQKQAEASNLTMAKYLEGLEKDREFAKAMALVEAGGQLMQPSATIGEGLGKAAQKFAKSSKEGQKEYNRSKLAILTLDAKINAAKAAASARAGIAGAQLQTAALSSERDALLDDLKLLEMQLDRDKPDPKQVDRLRRLQKQVRDLNNQIRAAAGATALASVGAGGDNIFGSYDLTQTG